MKLLDTIITWTDEIQMVRRDLHAHPELSYEEHRTSEKVQQLLQSWGIETHHGLGVTGVVGIVQGQRPGAAIGLRADMDALPMQELNEFEHKSRYPGKMHACGHDGHTAMLLGAARYLADHRDFAGTIYLIFQPAEEGHAGAKKMIEDGLFRLFPMQAVFGLHNWPGMPVGTFAVMPGAMMASSNTFDITITGKGAHGGMPNLGVDPVMTAVQLAQSMQTIISRNLDPLEPAVLSITQIHSGSADNVIPNEAIMRGTVRTFSLEALDLIESRMRELTESTVAAFQCSASFNFDRRYPPTINHAQETEFCAQVITKQFGAEHLRRDLRPSMGAEDFSFMLQEVPGCYVWLGNGDGDHRAAGHGLGPCMLHNGSYDFNDALLPIGSVYWVRLALEWLSEQQS